MNLRNVLRTYALLRSLTDDESALLETLRQLSESERELLVESLSPSKSTTKKAAKKSSSKSPRASGMARAIGDNLRQRRQSEDRCAYILQSGPNAGKLCEEIEASAVHSDS